MKLFLASGTLSRASSKSYPSAQGFAYAMTIKKSVFRISSAQHPQYLVCAVHAGDYGFKCKIASLLVFGIQIYLNLKLARMGVNPARDCGSTFKSTIAELEFQYMHQSAAVQQPPIHQSAAVQQPPMHQSAAVQQPDMHQSAAVQQPSMHQSAAVQQPFMHGGLD
jgi:hypothetical protein